MTQAGRTRDLKDAEGENLSAGYRSESYQYDIFGRRAYINATSHDLFPDYDGQQVVGERGTRHMLATYTLGAFGPAMRADCHGTIEMDDDTEVYYLWDATGNSVGIMRYDGENWNAVFEVHDAFGNRIAPNPVGYPEAGSYSWRGAEGSERDFGYAGDPNCEEPYCGDFHPASDEGTGLVYMQSRYYDPEIGRFMRADDLAMASDTSQGLNRYLYCENDPVNQSDPTGHIGPLAVLGAVGALFFAIGVAVGVWAAHGGLGASIITTVLGSILSMIPCNLPASLLGGSALAGALGWFFAILGAIIFATFESAIVAGFAFIGVAFGLGYLVGYGIGQVVDATTARDAWSPDSPGEPGPVFASARLPERDIWLAGIAEGCSCAPC